MYAVIKPKRWWWPSDRRKAKMLNIVQQHYVNMEAQLKVYRMKGLL